MLRYSQRGDEHHASVIPANAGIQCDRCGFHEDSAVPEKHYYVYLLASNINGTLYVGFTSDLVKRVWEHKNKATKGFTAEHGVDKLVWYETHGDVHEAILREKQIKAWKRQWKINLIQKKNPHWRDLYEEICG